MNVFRDPRHYIQWAVGMFFLMPLFESVGLAGWDSVWNPMVAMASLLGSLWFVSAAYRASTPVRGHIWNRGSAEEYACSVCGYHLPEDCERCVECGVESPVRRTTDDIHRLALMRFQAIGILFSMAAGVPYAILWALAIFLRPENPRVTWSFESISFVLSTSWLTVSFFGSMVTVGLAWILPRLRWAIRR